MRNYRMRLATTMMVALAITFLPNFALAQCPPWEVYSHTYYNGCGTKTIVGDRWTECVGGHGGWGTTTAHWRSTIATTCTDNGQGVAFCRGESDSYSYWEFCTGTGWVERSQTDFNNANCQCS